MNHDPRHFVFCTAVPYGHSLSGRSRHLAESLARRGHRVTYVELPCLRGMQSAPSAPPAGLHIEKLVSWPGFRRLARHLPRGMWLPQAQRRLRQLAADEPQTVLIVSAPFWQPILERHTQAVVCYLDALEVHAAGDDYHRLALLDEQLLARADLVTPVSHPLAVNLRHRFPGLPVQEIANGVPESWLETPPPPFSHRELGLAEDRPVLGFLGALFEWIDQDLLVAVARAIPHAQLVLVGPTRPSVPLDRLASLPNVLLFPAQPFDLVPRWMQTFDVCLAPFKRDLISEMADPLKIYEYLALGKPVVSTHRFGPPGDTPPMWVGHTAEEFLAAIAQALEQKSQDTHGRTTYAARHTWAARTDALLEALARQELPCAA